MNENRGENEDFRDKAEELYQANVREVENLKNWRRREEISLEKKRNEKANEINESHITPEEKKQRLKLLEDDTVLKFQELQVEFERRNKMALEKMNEAFRTAIEEKRVDTAAKSFPQSELNELLSKQKSRIPEKDDAQIQEELDRRWDDYQKNK